MKFQIVNVLIIIGILFLAAFLRLHKIGEYMTFLGDEGRDVLTVYNILHGDLTLLGPRSSAADFFYGPVYFYFIAPFLWLFRYSPIGPAVFVALIGIATVFLVYKIGNEFFGKKAAIFAASLYAVSPIVIAYSRSSWNPNPLPFFSLLLMFVLYKGEAKKILWLYIVVGILLGISFQLQYLATFLALIVSAYLFVSSRYQEKKIDIRRLLKKYLLLFTGFIIGWSLFLAFEVRHGFPNTKTLLQFILFAQPEKIYTDNNPFFSIVSGAFFKLFGRLVTRFPPPEQVNVTINPGLWFWQMGTIILAMASIVTLLRHKNKLQTLLLGIWLFLGVFLFGFYKKPIYDYYLGFMFPLPFLLIGNLLSALYANKKFSLAGKFISIGIFLFLFIYNLYGMPFRYAPNRQKDQVKSISDFVLSKTNNKPYNFALITLGNSDHAYRYFFKLQGKDPVTIESPQKDPERKTVTDQLLVVCEDPSCQPLGNSLWEVAGFGRAEIVDEWTVSVVKVYKLIHYKGSR